MAVTENQIKNALGSVIDPNTGKDLMSSKVAKNIQIRNGDVSLDVELGYPASSQVEIIRANVIEAILGLSGVAAVNVNVVSKIVAHSVQRGIKLRPNVKNIIAVASGKGGVGNRPPRSIWRWHCMLKAHGLAFWMRIFTDRHCR